MNHFNRNINLVCFRLLQSWYEDDPVGCEHPVRAVETGVSVSPQAPGQAGSRTPDVHDRVVPVRLLPDPAMAFRPQSLGHVHVRGGQGHIQGATRFDIFLSWHQ